MGNGSLGRSRSRKCSNGSFGRSHTAPPHITNDRITRECPREVYRSSVRGRALEFSSLAPGEETASPGKHRSYRERPAQESGQQSRTRREPECWRKAIAAGALALDRSYLASLRPLTASQFSP